MVWYRPQSPAQSHWEGTTSTYFVLASAILWAAMSVLGFLFAVDLSLTHELSIHVFQKTSKGWDALFFGCYLFLSSVLVGVLTAIPTVFVDKIARSQIDTLQKRSWNTPTIRVSLLRYLPFSVFVMSQFLALSLSVAAAPQYVRGLSERPTFLSSWSKLVRGASFNLIAQKDYGKLWKEMLEHSPTKALVFLLPSSILETPQLLGKTMKELGEPFPFFIDPPTFGSYLVQTLEGRGGLQERYFAPLATPEIFSASSGDAIGNTEFTIGPIAAWLAPEYRALEDVLTETPLDTRARSNFSISVTLRKRLALSQPQIYVLYRLGLLSVLYPQLRWEELVDDNLARLNRMASQIKTKDESSLKLLQLSELENIDPEIHHPYSGLRWPYVGSLTERQQILANTDTALAQIFSVVKELGNVSVFLLPYADSGPHPFFSHAFVLPARGGALENRIAALRSANLWYMPRDMAGLLRLATDRKNNDLDGKNLYSGIALCDQVFLPFNRLENGHDESVDLKEASWKFVNVDGNGDLNISTSLKFLYHAVYEHGVACRGRVVPGSPDRTLWVARLQTDLWQRDPQGEEKRVVDALFDGPQREVLSKNKKIKRTKKAPTQKNEVVEKVPEFDLYRVDDIGFGTSDVGASTAEEKQLFLKTFHDDIVPVLNDLARGRMLWE